MQNYNETYLDDDDMMDQMEMYENEGFCEAVDCGCIVEIDGYCPCGNPSKLMAWGLV